MEIWKEIKGYEGSYEISSLGRIKSLSRVILNRGKYPSVTKEIILNQGKDSEGYLLVSLYLNGLKKSKKVHQLMAIAFLNHVPNGHSLVVNHKDFNRLNNNKDNLEIVTTRVNSNKKHLKSSSKYTGVNWHKRDEKWTSCIRINGKLKHLGYFLDEYEAYLAYELALSKI